MTRRSVVIVLYWLAFMLVLIMIKGGTSSPWVLWLFVMAVALWSGIKLFFGTLGWPGPKLSPAVRRAYHWMYQALHILLAVTAIAVLFKLTGQPLLWSDAWVMLLVLLSVAAFHGRFHFWRHTALCDGALRLITRRFVHKWH